MKWQGKRMSKRETLWELSMLMGERDEALHQRDEALLQLTIAKALVEHKRRRLAMYEGTSLN